MSIKHQRELTFLCWQCVMLSSSVPWYSDVEKDSKSDTFLCCFLGLFRCYLAVFNNFLYVCTKSYKGLRIYQRKHSFIFASCSSHEHPFILGHLCNLFAFLVVPSLRDFAIKMYLLVLSLTCVFFCIYPPAFMHITLRRNKILPKKRRLNSGSAWICNFLAVVRHAKWGEGAFWLEF